MAVKYLGYGVFDISAVSVGGGATIGVPIIIDDTITDLDFGPSGTVTPENTVALSESVAPVNAAVALSSYLNMADGVPINSAPGTNRGFPTPVGDNRLIWISFKDQLGVAGCDLVIDFPGVPIETFSNYLVTQFFNVNRYPTGVSGFYHNTGFPNYGVSVFGLIAYQYLTGVS